MTRQTPIWNPEVAEAEVPSAIASQRVPSMDFGGGYNRGSLNGTHFAGIKQLKCMVMLVDFLYNSALWWISFIIVH